MHFIFDFDGTLIDSFACLIEQFNRLAIQHHFRQVDASELEQLRQLTSRELIKHLGIPVYRLPFVIKEMRERVKMEVPRLNTFPGLAEALIELHAANIKLGILTSNSVVNVERWLEKQGMAHFFQFIHSEIQLFGKARVLNKIIKRLRLIKNEVIYIGDETRDVEAAQKSEVKSAAVTWGFNAEAVLKRLNPDFMIRQPQELKGILKPATRI